MKPMTMVLSWVFSYVLWSSSQIGLWPVVEKNMLNFAVKPAPTRNEEFLFRKAFTFIYY